MRVSLFLVAASAVSLLAGSATAQDTPAQPNMSSTAGRDPTASPQTTPSAGSTMQPDAQPAASPMTSGATPPSGPTGSASSMPMASPTTTANSPAGDAPASYPVCTKTGQDRCRSTGRRGK